MRTLKKGSQNYRILERLKRGTILNVELYQDMNIPKYSSRISELREAGYQVDARQIKDGLWEYSLKGLRWKQGNMFGAINEGATFALPSAP